MKFIISSSVLLKNMQALEGVLNASNTLPILDDFLFELSEQSLKVTASDLETTMTVTLEPSKAESPGSVAIPAKILIDTLRTFADIPLTININEDTLGVEISAGEGKYKLSGHKSDEFPQNPAMENTTKLELDASLMVSAFNKTIFATGNDELRPVMSGVFCELTPDDVTFVATDAHKLVRYRRKDAKADESSSFILPKKPINQLKKILPEDDSKVNLEYNQTNAAFSFKNVNMICRLIEGKYPNYEAVIPNNNPNKLIVDRHMLLNSIKRVAIFANQSTHQVRFKISGKELVLSAEDVDFSNEAVERLTCSYEGDDMEIGFNSRFMQEMLTNLASDDIRLEMSAPNRAGIIFPVENDNEKEEILMLVMPVMLNQ
ncbi:MAG: DNA polymerase III subunit beta [Bacteroidota bacterium]|nr:DNA polymerase III subunit beta [Bacteroidota bacterium]